MCLMLYVGCKEPSDAPHVAPAAGACRDGYLATGANELSDDWRCGMNRMSVGS